MCIRDRFNASFVLKDTDTLMDSTIYEFDVIPSETVCEWSNMSNTHYWKWKLKRSSLIAKSIDTHMLWEAFVNMYFSSTRRNSLIR